MIIISRDTVKVFTHRFNRLHDCTVCRSGGHDPRDGRGGFTLVEVMVALVIMSIAMVTLLSTNVSSTRNYAESKVATICGMLAQRKIAEIQAAGFPETGEEGGAFEGNDNFRYMLSVTETDLEEMRQVTVDVSVAREGFEDEPGLPGVTMVTYVARLETPEEEDEEEYVE